MNNKYSMTAEAVSEGHPDKVADQISDAILDSALLQQEHLPASFEISTAQPIEVYA